MISEKQFAKQFPGFWNQCLPFLTPSVIAEMNLNGRPMPNSRGFVARPLGPGKDPGNNDLVAEIGFGIYVAATDAKESVNSLRNTELLNKVTEDAVARISRLRSFKKNDNIGDLREIEDSFSIANCLQDFFENEDAGKSVIQPRFKGCGILDSCYGDLFMGNTLFEVKCVERNLRSIDIRQVLTYFALNYQSRQFDITEVCIINPRRGISFRFNIEALSQLVSRKNSAELFHKMTDFLTNFEIIQLPS